MQDSNPTKYFPKNYSSANQLQDSCVFIAIFGQIVLFNVEILFEFCYISRYPTMEFKKFSTILIIFRLSYRFQNIFLLLSSKLSKHSIWKFVELNRQTALE